MVSKEIFTKQKTIIMKNILLILVLNLISIKAIYSQRQITIKSGADSLAVYNSKKALTQSLEGRIVSTLEANEYDSFHKQKSLEALEKQDFYNLSASLANLKMDSSLIYESLRVALKNDHTFTCHSLINFEYLEKTKNWNTPIYTLDKEKYIAFCEYCRATLEVPYDPSEEESEKRPYKIDIDNKDLLELSIIIRERDQMVRLLDSDYDLMKEVDDENFLGIDYILNNLDSLSKTQKSVIISNLLITMHHQPDIATRNRYKKVVIDCQCGGLNFMNGAFQYRTDRATSGATRKID